MKKKYTDFTEEHFENWTILKMFELFARNYK